MTFTYALKFDHKRCYLYGYIRRGFIGAHLGGSLSCKFNLSELDSRLILGSPYYWPRPKYLPQIELLGKAFDDPFVQDYMKHCPFPIISDNNQPRFVVKEADKTWTFAIEEVMAAIMRRALLRMFNYALSELDLSEKKCHIKTSWDNLETKLKQYRIELAVVVVVPNTFGEAQRRAMMVAAGLAGMNVTHIVSQTTAVASFFNTANVRDHGMEKESRLSQDGNFLFFHFGGSSLDISVIKHNEKDGLVEIKLATGDSTFGGTDFIHCLKEGVPKKFTESFECKGFEKALHLLNHDEVAFIPPPRMHFYWLKRGTHEFTVSEVEMFKEHSRLYKLRSRPTEPWKMTSEQREEAYNLEKAELEKASYRLTRQMYEQKCADLLKRVRQLLAEAIRETGIAPSDYQSVQMYGKYCRLPGVVDIIREQLPDTLISFGDNTSPRYVIENNVEYLGCSRERSDLNPCNDDNLFQLYEYDYDLLGAACLSFVSNRGRPLFRSRRGSSIRITHKNLRLVNKSQVEQLVPNL